MNQWVLWIELWSRALRDPDAAAKREALDRRWRSTISEVIREGQGTGEFGDRVDATSFAVALSCLIDGLAIQIILNDREISPGRARSIALGFAARELAPDAGVSEGQALKARANDSKLSTIR